MFSSCFACSAFDIVSLCVSLSKVLKSLVLSTSELPSVVAFCFGKILTSLDFLGAIGFSSDFCLASPEVSFESFFAGSVPILGVFGSETDAGSGVFRALVGLDVFPVDPSFLGVGGSGEADCDFILS